MPHTNNSINYKGMPDGIASATSSTVFTNKTIINTNNVIEEVVSDTSTSSATPSGGSLRNYYEVKAQDGHVSITFNAPSGTPVNGNYLMIRFKDDIGGSPSGTITWDGIYRFPTSYFGMAVTNTPPTAIADASLWYMEFRYNGDDSAWDCTNYVENVNV